MCIDLGDPLHMSTCCHHTITRHDRPVATVAYRPRQCTIRVTGPRTASDVLHEVTRAVRCEAARNHVLSQLVASVCHAQVDASGQAQVCSEGNALI